MTLQTYFGGWLRNFLRVSVMGLKSVFEGDLRCSDVYMWFEMIVTLSTRTRIRLHIYIYIYA